MTKHVKFLALVAVLAGCGDLARDAPPPLDRFRFPVGVALRHERTACLAGAPLPSGCACTAAEIGTPSACETQLFVVSSNFDLAYDTNEGGTLIALRVPEPSERPPGMGAADRWDIPDIVPYRRGAARIGSFGGEVALLDEGSCPGWESTLSGAPAAFVSSRSRDRLYGLTLGNDGSVTCGDGCRTDLDPYLRDPYGVALVCRGQGSEMGVSVYSTFLGTPLNVGFLSELALKVPASLQATKSPGLQASINVGLDAARHAVFSPDLDRLFFTGLFTGPGYMPLRWLDLALQPGLTNPPPPIDLAQLIYGAETTGLALSSDGTRAYVGLRLYDGYTAAQLGARTSDTGGALAVLDITPASNGEPSGRLLRLGSVGLGPNEVQVVKRPGLADLVAVTCNDGTLWLYDDATGGDPKQAFGADPVSGAPVLGKMPTGLAVESRASGGVCASPPCPMARIFVSSFESHFVSVVRLDDPAHPGSAWIEMRLGMAQ